MEISNGNGNRNGLGLGRLPPSSFKTFLSLRTLPRDGWAGRR